MGDDDITTAAAAALLNLDASRVRQLLRAGTIQGRIHGRDWVVSRASAMSYLDTRRPVGRPVEKATPPPPKLKKGK